MGKCHLHLNATFHCFGFYKPSTGNLRKQGVQLIRYGCKPTKQLGSCSSEHFSL